MCSLAIIVTLAVVLVPTVKSYIIQAKKLRVVAQCHIAIKAINTYNMTAFGDDYIPYNNTKVEEARIKINDDQLLNEKDITEIYDFSLCGVGKIVSDENALKHLKLDENGKTEYYDQYAAGMENFQYKY